MIDKNDIESLLNNGQYQEAKVLLDEYASSYPYDMDVICLYCMYYIYTNDLDMALFYAQKGVDEYPINGDIYYNLAYVYELLDNILDSAENYLKAAYIYEYNSDNKYTELNMSEKLSYINNAVQEYEDYLISKGTPDVLPELRKLQRYYGSLDIVFGLNCNHFRSEDPSIGKYWYFPNDERFVGLYNQVPFGYVQNSMNFVQLKASMINAVKSKSYKINGTTPFLLPVATTESDTTLSFHIGTNDYIVKQRYENAINYYKTTSDTTINSSLPCYFGNPIPLTQLPGNKKLVLSIFLDGVPYSLLNKEVFKKYMPYTYDFFSKGTICENAYATSEWTYPSIAGTVSGLAPTQHMMLNPNITTSIPKHAITLSEYYKNRGYFTEMINGNWRVIPPYGHSRGYDNIIYQHAYNGLKVQNIVTDTIDQIEAFKETNHFVWLSVLDSHLVADRFDLPISVQKNIDISCRADNTNVTNSVKQDYSPEKRIMFLEQLKHIDVHLNILFNYLCANYKEDEYVIGLFSDHGQSFLVENNQPLLSDPRSSIIMMFRGANVPTGICSDLISGTDYLPIMCHLGNISLDKDVNISGRLPIYFGGNTSREYTITETIFPGDPYQACIHTKDEICHFKNPIPTEKDGRIRLADSLEIYITDYNGNILTTDEKVERYKSIILNHIAKLLIY